MLLARILGWVKSCCDCCVVGSLWVLCCLNEPFLTNTDKGRGRISSRVLWDIQGNTARTHRWHRKCASIKFGPEAINHRNSDYSLYLTWICTFPCWPGASTVTILSFLWHFTFFFFSPWSAQDYLSLLKGNVTTSQSSPYWWVHMLEFKASITKIIIQWLKSNLQVATGRFSLISSHLHLHSMSLGFKMPFFVLVCDYLG